MGWTILAIKEPKYGRWWGEESGHRVAIVKKKVFFIYLIVHFWQWRNNPVCTKCNWVEQLATKISKCKTSKKSVDKHQSSVSPVPLSHTHYSNTDTNTYSNTNTNTNANKNEPQRHSHSLTLTPPPLKHKYNQIWREKLEGIGCESKLNFFLIFLGRN